MAQVIYSKSNKWFFVHIPKNGGSSFAEVIKGQPQRIRDQYQISLLTVERSEYHNTAQYFVDNYDVLADCTPVCIIRNPWSRCLSLFLYNIKNASQNLDTEWGMKIHSRLIREGFKQSWMNNGFFCDNENMLSALYSKRYWVENQTQYEWLTDNCAYFKIENGLDDFYDFIKIPPIKNILNTTSHADYRLYYDTELRDRIYNLYQQDVKKFNYDF